MFSVRRLARDFLKSINNSFRPAFDPHRLAFDPYIYNEGRWLDRDAEQRESRRLDFDFEKLLEVAISCSPGAQAVIKCTKKEGGFNRVFLISLDNNKTVVARLPVRSATPPELHIESEVATLRYIKEKTTVPVPAVLDWSSDSENPVDTAYIIMEQVAGVPLSKVWHSMKGSEHVACIANLGESVMNLCDLSFPGYGSIYTNTRKPPGAVIPLDDTYCIGPRCAELSWRYDKVAAAPGLQGPWRDYKSYMSGIFSQSPDYLARSTRPRTSLLATHGEMIGIAERTMALVSELPSFEAVARPVLLHPDFHTRNILVSESDHTAITGIIDWHFAAIEPPTVCICDQPDFAEDLRPMDQEYIEDLSTPQGKLICDSAFCADTWWVMCLGSKGLREAYQLPSGLCTFLAAPSVGFLFDPYNLRDVLDGLSRSWGTSGLPGQSLYSFDEPEDSPLATEMDERKGTIQLTRHLANLLRCDDDGWVPMERWDEVLEQYRLGYGRLVQYVQDEGRDQEKALEYANRLWPWDQR